MHRLKRFFFFCDLEPKRTLGLEAWKELLGGPGDSPRLQPLRPQAQTSTAFLESWVLGCSETRLGSDHCPSRPHGPQGPRDQMRLPCLCPVKGWASPQLLVLAPWLLMARAGGNSGAQRPWSYVRLICMLTENPRTAPPSCPARGQPCCAVICRDTPITPNSPGLFILGLLV